MLSLKKCIILLIVVGTLSSFVKLSNTLPLFNLEKIHVLEILGKQKNECRPSSKFMFYVETELVKKVRGANIINAKIYILNRADGASNLLASETILASSFKGAVFLQYETLKNDCGNAMLENGDKIIGNIHNSSFCFKQLVKFESIYNSYLISKNKLLDSKSL
jgi:hypothetical protein